MKTRARPRLSLPKQLSYPYIGLAGTVENGTALTLTAGQSVNTWLTAAAYTREGEIMGVNRQGEVG